MKVIKHGNTVKELTCPDCGCIFLAGKADSHKHKALHRYSYYLVDVIPCPECGAECREEDESKNSEDSGFRQILDVLDGKGIGTGMWVMEEAQNEHGRT